jgi:hypothetical protein
MQLLPCNYQVNYGPLILQNCFCYYFVVFYYRVCTTIPETMLEKME